MENSALFKIGYGLYVLTAKDGDKDNGCIINTAMQVTSTPVVAVIAVNKDNYTHDIIKATGEFNLSTLTEETKFSTIERFGYQSGRNVDKFENFNEVERAENGIYYLTSTTNSYLSCKVVECMDFETHTMFKAEVVDAKNLSNAETLTYSYYQSNVKPKPTTEPKTGYRCNICGYVYEGDPLPEDFICPICKHGAADFTKI